MTAQSYLPRPYLISGGGVYADFSDATVDAATIERILSGGEAETESQSALSTFDAPPGRRARPQPVAIYEREVERDLQGGVRASWTDGPHGLHYIQLILPDHPAFLPARTG